MKKFTLITLILALALFSAEKVIAQDIVDLTESNDPNVLVDTLDGVNDGAIILLKPRMVYNAGGFAFDSSVTIQSADPLNLDRPKIYCGSNFNFAEGAMVDSIIFKNIEFFGEYDARYVLNSNVAVDSIGKIVFESCYIHDLRGVVRTKDAGPGVIDQYTMNNCVVNMVRDYGIITIDRDDWKVNHFAFTNTTFSKIRSFMTSKNNTKTMLFEGCNLVEATAEGQRMFRWRNSAQEDVLDGIMIKNTIFGPGWDENAVGSTGIDAFDGLGATTWTFENTFVTSDFDIADTKDSIDGFNSLYAGLSTDLWVNVAESNFHLADTTFAGKGTAGDQRWGIPTASGGLEWNISDRPFKYLGTMEATQKVAGLNIFAAVGKSVVVDGNNKTVDGMSFTNRMKLGGSGGFDGDGLPVNRVLTIDLDHSSSITVAAMSSSSSSDRILNVAVGHKDSIIGEHAALGAELTMSTYEYYGGPTTLMLYSPSSGVNVYYVTTEDIANTDSLLRDLTVSVGELTPAFDPNVVAYTVLVPDGTTEVIVTGTANDPNATVTAADTVDVSSGSGISTITCVAENGVGDMEYVVTITVDVPPPTPAEITFIVDDTDMRESAGFGLKGSWVTETGEYDAAWSDGAEHTKFFDDGTHGDVTIGDNIWTVTLQLIPDGGVNTWEWGVNDANGNWIDGNFQFTVTDETAQTLDAFVIVGVDPAHANSFSIYPNPASSTLYVDNAEQVVGIEVINLAGQTLIQEVNRGNSTLSISVDGLASGVYVMRLTDINNTVNHQKLIIE